MGENKKEVKARKKAFRKAKHRAIRPWKGLSIVCAILAVIFVPLYSLLNVFDNSLAIFVGGTFWKLKNEDQSAQYFTSDFESTEDMVDYGLQLVQQVEAEGAALLMNENNALPLAEGANVSLFSNSSVNLVYGGTGSGNIDASTADTLKTAMEKTGFNVNETLWNFYESEEMGMYKRGSGGTITTPSTIFPNTMHKHIPIPNKSAPNTDKMIVPTVFPFKWIGSFPSILLQTISVIRRITSPITPAITPCRNIPHSSISAMHMPSAKNTIPIVPSINAAKLLFFMFVFLISLYYLL